MSRTLTEIAKTGAAWVTESELQGLVKEVANLRQRLARLIADLEAWREEWLTIESPTAWEPFEVLLDAAEPSGEEGQR